MTLDATDIKLLRVLQEQGRITNSDLADQIGLSQAACHKRLRRLETEGVIRGYAAIVDRKALGSGQTVFVHITLESQGQAGLEAFERAILNVPEVIECYLMSGDYDYLLHVVVRDAEEFERLHRHVLSGLPGVTRMTSSFGLRTVRRTTAIPLHR